LDDGARAAHRHDASAIEAPMPGRVVKIGVEPGQAVERGDELIVVEAGAFVSPRRVPQMAGSDIRISRAAVPP
jgi:acetyl/propionyl-CoA carboxylase alpha subunit